MNINACNVCKGRRTISDTFNKFATSYNWGQKWFGKSGFMRHGSNICETCAADEEALARPAWALVCVLLVLVAALVSACGGSGGGAKGAGGAAGTGGSSEPTGAAFAQPESVAEPQPAPPLLGETAIHVENTSEGYVVAQATSAARLKFQVTNGDQTYNYDLPNDGTPIVYPLNMGNGSYLFRIMQNTSGSNYVELAAESADVVLNSEFSPFLFPNVFCDYNESSACVSKAREVTAGASNVGQAVKLVCEFVANTIVYDNDKAAELAASTGYVPNPDETLATGKGVCFDYASLAAAMLRSLGIPTKVVTGYVGANQLYHAWIMVYIDGSWQTALFKVDPNTWSRCDVTFASTGSTQYTGDASAYSDRYTY